MPERFLVYVDVPSVIIDTVAVIYEQKTFVVVGIKEERAIEILRAQYPTGIITTNSE